MLDDGAVENRMTAKNETVGDAASLDLGFDVLPEMETLTRHDPGIDWGGKRRVVARSADGRTRLFICQGHTAPVGARGFGRDYHPMRVVLWAAKSWNGWAGHQSKDVAESRFDAAAIRRDHGALIDEVFGCPGLSDHLDGRKTLVVRGSLG